MISEFGEEISEKTKKDLIERILKLSDKLIDELWFRCDLIYERPKSFLYKDNNKYFKALIDDLIDEMRKDKEDSTTFLTLINQTRLGDIMTNLDDIERENAC
jgi:hypothetical protein